LFVLRILQTTNKFLVRLMEQNRRINESFSYLTMLLMIFFLSIAKAGNNGKIVFVQDGIGELQKSEKQIAINFWDDYFNKRTKNYSVSSSVTSIDKFMKHLDGGKIDYVLLDGSNYIQYYHRLEPNLTDEAWLVQRTEHSFEEFVLLVRQETNIDHFRQLRNTVFSLHSGYGLLRLYLEQLVLKTSNMSITDYFKEIRDAKTESQAILDVYFSNSDACVVAKHVFDDAIELNPAIKEKIKIIQRTERIYAPAIYLALNGVSKQGQQNFSRGVDMLNNTIRGRQILDLFGIHIIKRIDPKKLQPMLQQNIAWRKY